MRIHVNEDVTCSICIYGRRLPVRCNNGFIECRFDASIAPEYQAANWCRHAVTAAGRARFEVLTSEEQRATHDEPIPAQLPQKRLPKVGQKFRARSLGNGDFFAGVLRCIAQLADAKDQPAYIVAVRTDIEDSAPAVHLSFPTIGWDFVILPDEQPRLGKVLDDQQETSNKLPATEFSGVE